MRVASSTLVLAEVLTLMDMRLVALLIRCPVPSQPRQARVLDVLSQDIGAQEVAAKSDVAAGLRGIMKELTPLDTKSSQVLVSPLGEQAMPCLRQACSTSKPLVLTMVPAGAGCLACWC